MTIEVALLISLVSVAFSVFFGLKNNRRTDEKDIADRIARDTRTDMKLDEISADVKEVKETVKNIQNDVKDHEGRIVKLEASYKAEHKRLDEVFRMANIKEVDRDE
jgi:peptidoglycan hydrolase CwlO-like protein